MEPRTSWPATVFAQASKHYGPTLQCAECRETYSAPLSALPMRKRERRRKREACGVTPRRSRLEAALLATAALPRCAQRGPPSRPTLQTAVLQGERIGKLDQQHDHERCEGGNKIRAGCARNGEGGGGMPPGGRRSACATTAMGCIQAAQQGALLAEEEEAWQGWMRLSGTLFQGGWKEGRRRGQY